MLTWYEWLIAIVIGIVAFFVILRLTIGACNLIDDVLLKKTKRN